MERYEKMLCTYLAVIARLKKNGVLDSVNCRTEDTEDAYDLLYLPVCRLADIYESWLNDKTIMGNIKTIAAIADESNAIWYAIDCRSDISTMIPKRILDLDVESCNILSDALGRTIPSRMDIREVHLLAGEIEMFIRQHCL